MQFPLRGPIAAPATCATNGTDIGAAVAVEQHHNAAVQSAAATVTSAGHYCWPAHFTSDTEASRTTRTTS